MRKTSTFRELAGALGATLCLLLTPANAQHRWPIDPTGSTHPIGDSFGEFQRFGADGGYQHKGIDIRGAPKFNDDFSVNPSAPWVRVTVEGWVIALEDNPASYTNYATVLGIDGLLYKYGHIEFNSFDRCIADSHDDILMGTKVYPGDKVGKLFHWNAYDADCDFHHVHYEVKEEVEESGVWVATLLNPFFSDASPPAPRIDPHVDTDPPEIHAILFGKNHATPWDSSTPWVKIDPVAPGACTKLSGSVDIIVQARDRDDAGTTLLGTETQWVYDMRWRVCPESAPDGPWQSTRAMDRMPYEYSQPGNAATSSLFSYSPPWESDSNYCTATWLYAIVTNFVGGSPDVSGVWNTNAVPDGHYTVGVRLVDFAGNTSSAYASVCVLNGPVPFPEFGIRDAFGDDGALPFTGGTIGASPDIMVNRGTPQENKDILIGSANTIEVTVWNIGCSDIPASSTYDAGIEWVPLGSTPGAPVPGPGKTIKVPAGGLAPGKSQMERFTWTPDASKVSPGSGCLRAWVSSAQDPKQATASVEWDDNQAQRNLNSK